MKALDRLEAHLKVCATCRASTGHEGLCEVGRPLWRKARRALLVER